MLNQEKVDIMLRKIWNIAKNNKRILKLLSIFYNFFGMNNLYMKGKWNKINKKTSFLKKCKFNIKGSGNKIILKDGVRLTNCKLVINGNNNTIVIDQYSAVFNVVFWIEDSDNKISVGKRTVLNGGHFAVTENHTNLTIGDLCLFSSDIEIRTGDSHSIIDIKTGKRINYAKDVNIGNHVWIGAHVTILKGVKISDDVIIANSAVLTKSIVKSHCVIGGFPIKVIKENVTWQNERIYEENCKLK